jgi:glycosyltransferase involved in cell wall biosynthesis
MNPRIAYVVKRYPRFSETFIVNELLAHEAANWSLDLFSLRPPVDTHFQDIISRVRAPLTYLSDGQVKSADLWSALGKARHLLKVRPDALYEVVQTENVLDSYCGLQLAIHCVQRGIQHIHAHFASSAASVARIASLLTGLPYSMTAHAKDIFHESVQPDDLSRKLRSASTTFTVSDFNLNYLRTQYPQSSERVVRLYNGISLLDFDYRAPVDRPNRIVAVGRFVEKKGFEDLLVACKFLQDRELDFKCQLIGGGELESKLRSMIERLGLHHCVQLLGPQPQRIVKELVQSAAVMAVPCVQGRDGNRDGLPTVLLESMALGTPCISTAVTGIPEVIRHDESGIIVSEQAPSELADAMMLMMSKPGLRVRYAVAARQIIEQDFDIHQNALIQRSFFVDGTSHPLVIHEAAIA